MSEALSRPAPTRGNSSTGARSTLVHVLLQKHQPETPADEGQGELRTYFAAGHDWAADVCDEGEEGFSSFCPP